MRHFCESFVLYCSDSLIQQTGCDLMTSGCQGESGGAMAVEGTVGESQLQRIIRDLHGTLPLCVCMCETGCRLLFLKQCNSTKKKEGFPLYCDLRDFFHIIIHLELSASSYSLNQFGTWAFE